MTENFILNGQGVFIFETHEPCIEIQLYDKLSQNVLIIEISDHIIIQKYKNNTTNTPDCTFENHITKTNHTSLKTPNYYYYWISLDAQTQQIQIGIGEPCPETVIYAHQSEISEKSFLESLYYIDYHPEISTPIKILKDPIPPLFIGDTTKVSNKIK